jgi:hypothetical protein
MPATCQIVRYALTGRTVMTVSAGISLPGRMDRLATAQSFCGPAASDAGFDAGSWQHRIDPAASVARWLGACGYGSVAGADRGD